VRDGVSLEVIIKYLFDIFFPPGDARHMHLWKKAGPVAQLVARGANNATVQVRTLSGTGAGCQRTLPRASVGVTRETIRSPSFPLSFPARFKLQTQGSIPCGTIRSPPP